jgi:hypothetical protein
MGPRPICLALTRTSWTPPLAQMGTADGRRNIWLEPADVIISDIYYVGQVPRVECDEYAVIRNQGGSAVDLGGWHLNAGDPDQGFWFPSYALQPGQGCRVYTNEYYPEFCGFSFGSGRALWNNDGDCAYVFNAAGAQVSQHCY